MKLSKAQMKILEHMGKGGVYVWIKGVEGHGFWSGESWKRNTPRVNIRSIHKLLDLDFIRQIPDWRSIEYLIADKGRKYLRSLK